MESSRFPYLFQSSFVSLPIVQTSIFFHPSPCILRTFRDPLFTSIPPSPRRYPTPTTSASGSLKKFIRIRRSSCKLHSQLKTQAGQRKMNRTLNTLLLGLTVGILCQGANARTGGFVQTSYFSTNGGTASGAAESSVIGPDGVKKGECSYSNSTGHTVKIKYEEGSDGQLIKGSVNGKEGKGDISRFLGECRGTINTLSGSVASGIAEGIEESKGKLSEFERSFQEQMENFNRQQETFINQQSSFFEQMADFARGMLNNHRQVVRNTNPYTFFW